MTFQRIEDEDRRLWYEWHNEPKQKGLCRQCRTWLVIAGSTPQNARMHFYIANVTIVYNNWNHPRCTCGLWARAATQNVAKCRHLIIKLLFRMIQHPFGTIRCVDIICLWIFLLSVLSSRSSGVINEPIYDDDVALMKTILCLQPETSMRLARNYAE